MEIGVDIVPDSGFVVVVEIVVSIVGFCLECFSVACPGPNTTRLGRRFPDPSVGARLLLLEHFIRWYILFCWWILFIISPRVSYRPRVEVCGRRSHCKAIASFYKNPSFLWLAGVLVFSRCDKVLI